MIEWPRMKAKLKIGWCQNRFVLANNVAFFVNRVDAFNCDVDFVCEKKWRKIMHKTVSIETWMKNEFENMPLPYFV